ncbi:MAG TPA: ROK family transcriptional regulator [Candidatus Lumbricidophila sp.]|nr:ROK family transcriptional regulator [Candidatus Lumbricidophila sp.]
MSTERPEGGSADRSTGTPAWLGAMNDRAGLAALIDHGPLVRNRVCELVGVSKPTASSMMNRLIAAGLAQESGTVTGGSGPNAVRYSARVDRFLGVAMWVDGPYAKACVVDAAGTDYPVAKVELATDTAKRSAITEVRAGLRNACAAAGVDPAAVTTVCVGITGWVTPGDDGELVGGRLPGWPRFGLLGTLTEALGRTVLIENDVNLVAIADRGARIGTDLAVLVFLGVGVGAALDFGGHIHRGQYGGSGEIGFIPLSAEASRLDPEAKKAEDLVSWAAVLRLAAAFDLDVTDPDVSTNPRFDEFLDQLGERIGHVLLPLVSTLDPAGVTLAGPTAALGGIALARRVEHMLQRTHLWHPTVAVSAIGDDGALEGARILLQRQLRATLLDRVAQVTTS